MNRKKKAAKSKKKTAKKKAVKRTRKPSLSVREQVLQWIASGPGLAAIRRALGNTVYVDFTDMSCGVGVAAYIGAAIQEARDVIVNKVHALRGRRRADAEDIVTECMPTIYSQLYNALYLGGRMDDDFDRHSFGMVLISDYETGPCDKFGQWAVESGMDIQASQPVLNPNTLRNIRVYSITTQFGHR